jgi:hypothetical protein
LRPMVRLSPSCFSASASVATAMRVMECSWETIGSVEGVLAQSVKNLH